MNTISMCFLVLTTGVIVARGGDDPCLEGQTI